MLLILSVSGGWAQGAAEPAPAPAGQREGRSDQGAVAAITLRDVHPLYGGQIIHLLADGRGYCQLLSHREGEANLFERRYKLTLGPEVMGRLLSLATAYAGTPAAPGAGPGLPDASRPMISLRLASGRTLSGRRWAHDTDPTFIALYQALLDVARAAPAQQLLRAGQFEMDWMAPGFGMP